MPKPNRLFGTSVPRNPPGAPDAAHAKYAAHDMVAVSQNAAAEDLMWVCDFEKEHFKYPMYIPELSGAASDPVVLFLVFQGVTGPDSPTMRAGYLIVDALNDPPATHIVRIGVAEPFRNRGFGSWLLRTTTGMAFNTSRYHCISNLDADDFRACHWMARRGFKVTKESDSSPALYRFEQTISFDRFNKEHRNR